MGLDNPLHIAIVLLIVVLLFGAKRIPELGRSLGQGMREFRHHIDRNSDEPKRVEEPPQEPSA